jgi:aryl-phospho-beta-D-glucosidase BglC (GH1 family)
MRSGAFLAIACAGLMLAAEAEGASPPEGVSDARFGRLACGINLSHWFAQSPRGDYSREHLTTYNTERDLDLIARMGFSHVRLTLNPKAISDAPEGLPFHAERLALLDAAVAGFLARHVAVVVDLHPDDNFKTPLAKDDAAVERLVAFWRALAAHFAGTDPERVFFEVMNEPVIPDAARWNAVQKQVLAAMRASAPRHTLIATGPRWSSVDELEKVEPVADRNVVYNFHCYEPFRFTHQGATWAGDWVKGLKNAPYPSNPEAVAGVLADLPDEKARENMIQYGKENWNAEKIDAVIARAAAWGKKKGVPLTCNEFGVYRKVAPTEARLRWIRDVRTALEKHHIGWAMWDYAGGFSVVVEKDGRRVPDPATLESLGLKSAE